MSYLRSRYFIVIFIFLIFAMVSFIACGKKSSTGVVSQSGEKIDYYTCGMHPSVRVSPEEYNKGNTNCPICNMNLTPVHSTVESKGSVSNEHKGSKGSARHDYKDSMTVTQQIQDVDSSEIYYGCGIDKEGHCSHCDLGKSDANCICGEHSFMVKGKKINCPVCKNPLRVLTQDEADKLKGVVSRVTIKGEQAKRAGVRTGPVRKLHLFKEIRTVGTVAHDPKLAIAQEEYISAVITAEKINEGTINEIKDRAEKLVESSKRKLMLLGLGEDQVEDLRANREIQTSLVLPEKKMWIYGEVYEYELNWIKVGGSIKVTSDNLPGEVFEGVISSVNPVVDSKKRSIRFRAEVDNPNLTLKPEMYVDVSIQSMYKSLEGEHLVLAIPKDAVLDTGVRKIVWLDNGGGEYEGRDIIIGPQAVGIVDEEEAKFYPVLRGLSEGELVVTKANFLIDSQSQISGVASSAYGGALGGESKKDPMKGSHAGAH